MSVEIEAHKSYDGKLYDSKSEAQLADIKKLLEQIEKKISFAEIEKKIVMINSPKDIEDTFYSIKDVNLDFKFEHLREEILKHIEHILDQAEDSYYKFQEGRALHVGQNDYKGKWY